jgi:hypothetical protein
MSVAELIRELRTRDPNAIVVARDKWQTFEIKSVGSNTWPYGKDKKPAVWLLE